MSGSPALFFLHSLAPITHVIYKNPEEEEALADDGVVLLFSLGVYGEKHDGGLQGHLAAGLSAALE